MSTRILPAMISAMHIGSRSHGDGPDGPLQRRQELMDSGFLFFGQFTLTAKQAGVEFCREQRVLEAFHHPVEDRDDHLEVHILTQLAPLQTEADETHRAVRVFSHQKTVNLTLQDEIGPVVSQHGYSLCD